MSTAGPDNFGFVLCGITVQQAGEVIQNTRTTRLIRPECRESYINALEDFACAVVLGDRFWSSGKFPGVGEEFPGERLVERSQVRGLYQPVAVGNTGIDQIWRDEIRRQEVISRLTDFSTVFHEKPVVYHQWLIREATAYFDSYARRQRGQSPEHYRDYWPAAARAELIPPGLLSGLAQVLAEYVREQGTLKAFVADNILSLVTISMLYDQAARETGRIRLPNITRAQIIYQRAHHGNQVPNGLLRRMAAAVLNEGLKDLGAKPGDQLPDVLIGLRERSIWKETRALLGGLARSDGEGSTAELWARLESFLLDEFEPDGGGENDAFIPRNLSLLRGLSRKLNDGNYLDRLCRAFPDLESGTGQRRTSGVSILRRSDQVFVSYCHKDAPWLEQFKVYLKPPLRELTIDVWDDTRIPVGHEWEVAIQAALRRAGVAVLLVSQRFLASDFIFSKELPVLVEAAKRGELRIVPIVISACSYASSPLKDFQAVNDVKVPLDTLSGSALAKELVRIAEVIAGICERAG